VSAPDPFDDPRVLRGADPFLVGQLARPLIEITRAVLAAPAVRPMGVRILADARAVALPSHRVTTIETDRALGAVVRALRTVEPPKAARVAARVVREAQALQKPPA
jgi:hypothetical protein